MSYHLIEDFEEIQQLKDKLLDKNIIKDHHSFHNKHFEYFGRYFKDVKVSSIIIEGEYIDKDYLEDYSNYYSRSFYSHPRTCARLHLFSIKISEEIFDNALVGNLTEDELQKGYIGFIVLKPIPETIIGRTCIEAYPEINGRYFPIRRKYYANLFGINFSIRSLAYQEQDRVAACATSALWSAFQYTSISFQHALPTPYQITADATVLLPFANRRFPNEGLTSEQMAHAIRNVGLESIVLNPKNKSFFKAAVYAYIKGEVPIILGIKLYDKQSLSNIKDIGHHAVLIVGYKLGKRKLEIYDTKINLGKDTEDTKDEKNLFLTSSKVNKLFVHDDQIGPFARVEIDDKSNAFDLKQNSFSINTTWDDLDEKLNDVRAIPTVLLLPAYHKIRIPYDIILSSVQHFNNHLVNSVVVDKDIEWDIYLTKNNDFKSKIKKSEILEKNFKKELLIKNYPRYIWIASARIEEAIIFRIVFDATDIEQGNLLIEFIHYTQEYKYLINAFASKTDIKKVKNRQVRYILQWHLENIKDVPLF